MATGHSEAAEQRGDSLSPRSERARATIRWYQLLLAGAVVLMLALPVAARLAADNQPVRPSAPVPRLPPLASARTATVEPLPRASSPGARLTLGSAITVAAVHADFLVLARPLLGPKPATVLWRVVTSERHNFLFLNDQVATVHVRSGSNNFGEPVYPFRYPPLRPILNGLPKRLTARQVARLNDLGALLMLTAARFPLDDSSLKHPGGAVPNSAAVGYALLDRARAGGACAPQENLALLVAADQVIRESAAEQEFQRAERVCPGDPTPMWVQGQFEAQQALEGSNFIGPRSGPYSSVAYRLTRPLLTYRRLQRAFPRLAAGSSGEADVEMRIGYQIDALQPFSARERFARALALYRRGAALQPGPDMLQGEARALAALGNVPAAAALERQASAQAHKPAAFRPWLIDDLEGLHEFSLAAHEADLLIGQHAVVGPGLYPDVPAAIVAGLDPIRTEDFGAPFSTGTDELTPVTLHVGPSPGGASAAVSDLAFIPNYRPTVGLGGESRWCPDWSRRLDLLLAGQPSEALSGMPATFRDIRGGQCSATLNGGSGELGALAELEVGDVPAALRWVKANGTYGISLSQLQDDRQNIWRYAGNLERADAATTQWTTLLPNDPLALIRKGEVAFLRGRYEEAVLAFQAAVRTARVGSGLWSHDEAQALLDEGAALIREHRRGEALTAFSAADTTASAWLTAFSAKSSDPDASSGLRTSHTRRGPRWATLSLPRTTTSAPPRRIEPPATISADCRATHRPS